MISTHRQKKSQIFTNSAGRSNCSSAGSSRRLKIRHFIGVSENAVRIQIAIALIAFLILRMAQVVQKTVHSPLEFARLVRANLMHRRPINDLLNPLQPMPINSNQLKLGLYFP